MELDEVLAWVSVAAHCRRLALRNMRLGRRLDGPRVLTAPKTVAGNGSEVAANRIGALARAPVSVIAWSGPDENTVPA
jgi:hypothetical protein